MPILRSKKSKRELYRANSLSGSGAARQMKVELPSGAFYDRMQIFLYEFCHDSLPCELVLDPSGASQTPNPTKSNCEILIIESFIQFFVYTLILHDGVNSGSVTRLLMCKSFSKYHILTVLLQKFRDTVILQEDSVAGITQAKFAT